MDDYANILSDFPGPPTSPLAESHQIGQTSQAGPSGVVGVGIGDHPQDSSIHPNVDFNFESFVPESSKGANGGHGSGPARGGSALTADEKKEKQRKFNRLAAEKSRHKKRDELSALEAALNHTQEENQRLRQRLSALTASSGATPSTPQAAQIEPTINEEPNIATSSAPPQEVGIDYTYLGKIQSEITASKTLLLKRQLELARLKAGSGEQSAPSADLDVERHLLLSSHAQLAFLQAESDALAVVTDHIRKERSDLARQREMVVKELAARRGHREVTDAPNGEGQGDDLEPGRSSGADKTLMEIRGWVDAAVKSWEQTSSMPEPQEGDDVARLGDIND